MIPIRVNVDEDTLASLERRADLQRKSVPDAIGTFLKVADAHLPQGGRVVVLSGDALEQLEAILGGGSVLNQQDLVAKVSRLAGISFHHIRLPFTPNMLEELTEKARRQGLTAEQLIERTAPRVYEQFFDLMARV